MTRRSTGLDNCSLPEQGLLRTLIIAWSRGTDRANSARDPTGHIPWVGGEPSIPLSKFLCLSALSNIYASHSCLAGLSRAWRRGVVTSSCLLGCCASHRTSVSPLHDHSPDIIGCLGLR